MGAFRGNYREIVVFVAKAMAVYVLWYLLYHLWLLPDGRLDELLSRNIVAVTATMLKITGYEVFAFDRIVGISLANGLEIIDGCNGIETIGLFFGFVMAYPGHAVKRWLFIPTGILIIYLANVVRIYLLAIVQYHWYSGFQVIHDYTFNLIFYLVVFALWAIWALRGGSMNPVANDTDGSTDTGTQGKAGSKPTDRDTTSENR
jgi:exosortase family protein XrtF